MLRAALPLSRRALLRSAQQPARAQLIAIRSYADHQPPVLPGSASSSQTATTPAPPGSVAPGQPAPVAGNPAVAQTPPPPPPNTPPPTDAISQSGPAPKKKPRRFRNFLLTLLILGGLGFGGGVYYSSVSDNFHDFFTEYVPFGEQAVLYFEEREFRKRFPRRKHESTHLPSNSEEKVTIGSKSGLSWRLSEDGKEKQGESLPKSALSALLPGTAKESAKTAQQSPVDTIAPEKNAAVAKAKIDAGKKGKSSPKQEDSAPAASSEQSAPKPPSGAKRSRSRSSSSGSRKTPEVNEPSVFVPLGPIDPLAIKNADEPLVQDLAKILNDIILIANADNATGKFSGAMAKAKAQLDTLGQQIINLKATERKAAEDKTKESETKFDNAAKELVRRLEAEMKQQEGRWRDEFETERARLQSAFDERLKSEGEHASKLAEEKLQNDLIAQAISLKKDFTNSVHSHVEAERNGRLAKLTELSGSVEELRNLTGEWNKVLESNLSTQHLLNAVEAVKASLESADRPRPFVRELAALSEIANKNDVVDAALEGISPAAYTYGIPTRPQLIERFRRVADEVRKASLLPENAGMASHATSYVLSKVMFKKEGSVEGTDVESSLLRTEILLEEGRLDDAAREVNGLTGWAKTLSKDWLSEVRRVLEVKQALQVIETEARLQALKVD